MKCLDEECAHEWEERSHLADRADCPECGGPARPFKAWDDEAEQLPTRERERRRDEKPRVAFARERARAVLRDHQVTAPPVPVEGIARAEGFSFRDRDTLGQLRARLVDDVIELPVGEREEVKRFSIAHELGHHFLGTTHLDGSPAETEADTFANELLVPRELLRAAVEETTSLRALAGRFRVSRQVMEIAAKHHRLYERLTD